MEARNFHLHGGKKGAALAIRVIPRSSKNEISEILSDGTIKVRLAAPGGEAQANVALLQFLAEVLGIPAAKMEIVAGQNGHDKLVSIIDLDSETVHQLILAKLA